MTGPEPGQMTCDEVRELAGAFVLGALAPADDAAVRAHLASCDDGHAEMAELGGVLPALAGSVPVVEPPVALKARIMAAAAADLQARRGATTTEAGQTAETPTAAANEADGRGLAPTTTAAERSAPISAPTTFPSATERLARRSRASTGTWVLRIAAVLAIAILGGWNVLLQGQLSSAKTYERDVAAVIDMAAQPGSLAAVLVPDGGKGSGIAAINSRGELSMAMLGLAPTSGNAVYEAWLIGSDGVPEPIGSFKVDDSGVAHLAIKVLPPAAGAVLALTLEPAAHPTTPTLPIISKGVTTSAG